MDWDRRETRDAALPSRLDATPASGGRRGPATGADEDGGATGADRDGTATGADRNEAASTYGHRFLETAGYLTEPRERETAYAAGRSVRYTASVAGPVRIGYFEFPFSSVPRETPVRIARGLARRTRLQYCWFVDPATDRVRVVRTAGRPAQFDYDPASDPPSRRGRLERAEEDIAALFDRSDVVDRFAGDLRAERARLARTLTIDDASDATGRERLLAAQRLLDRLLYCYVLVAGGVVVPVDGDGTPASHQPSRVFRPIVRECDDVAATLATIVETLHAPEPAILQVTDSRRLHVPFLGRDDGRSAGRGPGVDDPTGDRTTATVDGFDWDGLLDRLDGYDWRLSGFPWGDGRESGVESNPAANGTITPAVLGDCGERFVVAVRDFDDGRLDEPDDAARSEPHSGGNDELGAYYTGERIADFVGRRALWEALRESIDKDLAAGTAPSALESTPLYRPARGRRREIEAAQRDGFDALYEACGDDERVLAYVDAKLRDLTVCDPAVGSGSFVLAVANVLFEWRSMCRPTVDAATLRREIVADNVFGVDVRDDVAARCRRRLRCWVLAATPIADREPSANCGPDAESETGANRPTPPALSARSIGIRSGNSLFGITDPDAVSETVPNRPDPDPQDPEQYDAVRAELDERFASTRCDAETGSPLEVEDRVDTASAAWESLRTGSTAATTLCVEVPSGIPDGVDAALNALGFTTYTYKARLERPFAESPPGVEPGDLGALFGLLGDRIGDRDAWSVVVEREYAGVDFAPDALDACHWPLEFPEVFDDGGFDVVVSNPPYGAELGPEAEPLVKRSGTYTCQGASDTCEWFLERMLTLASETGVVAAVVPKSVAFYGSWSDVRGRLLAETTIKHVLDVGLGFAGVTLETIALVGTCADDGDGPVADTAEREGAIGPTIHRSRDCRQPTANEPVHLGRVPRRYVRDAGTIVFRPITDDQDAVLDRIVAADRRLGEVLSTDETTRQLYVPDDAKANLDEGTDPYVEKVPWVSRYHLTDVRYADLSDYDDAVERYTVPRVMLKVLRGSRLRAWLDPIGALVGTEKLVNVPLTGREGREIAFVYAVCNHPFASFYLQKTIFSETTETARVLDGQYSRPIPVPDPGRATEAAVARLAWTLTIARQLAVDRERGTMDAAADARGSVEEVTVPVDAGDRDLEDVSADLERALEALVAACYLRDELCDRWTAALERRGPAASAVETLFDEFYAERYARADGTPGARWPAIRDVLAETVAVTDDWAVDRIHESHDLAVVRDVLE
ncbi:Eco57I restriction-modification methylase domain-containing protein [Halosolutus halophilus]|uniref:Eco57I restriction-modification methylase domain-containing protein n=1 Tax=Halosolutus halophilus TaxID=1552990 RepID=UPI00223529DF|nr:N-6 DNA methylase [Halosolutus halophilus]